MSELKKKRKVGRPSKYGTIDLKLVERIAGLGFIEEDMAAILDVAYSTLTDYKDKHPEFSVAIKRGRAQADEKVVNALMCNALGGFTTNIKERFRKGKLIERSESFAKPDVIAQIFWLKNRQKENWRDRQEIDHNIKEYKYVELKHENSDKLKAESERLAETIIANRGRTCLQTKGESA